jgi:NADPH:quinone reductase-like Zn-dependent oxidoreductase
VLAIREVTEPVPTGNDVVIRVEAFGLNHAEAYMRSGAWGAVADITGIECAGRVHADPSGVLAPGTAVIAILGGMGRTRRGAYAEYVAVPATNVLPVETALAWEDLAAIPETYCTAWYVLHDNLRIAPRESVLVRGATSALGQAFVNLAVDAGAEVTATTRDPARTALLERIGAHRVVIDDGRLATSDLHVDHLVDVVGNATLRDSLHMLRPRGRLCQVGFLGGFEPVADFNPIVDLPTGVQLSFFGSAFVLGSAEYPLTRVPLDDILAKAADGRISAKPTRVFGFTEVAEAHKVMEAGAAGGKMVVRLAGS